MAAKLSSFDVVSEPDLGHVQNAVDQVRRETAQRYDFRGHAVQVDLDLKALELRLTAPTGMVMEALRTLTAERLSRCQVSLRFFDMGPAEPVGHDRSRAVWKIRKGLTPEAAKAVVKAVRETGLKVEAQIQGDGVRISGKSKDELQRVIGHLRSQDFGVELGYTNYR